MKDKIIVNPLGVDLDRFTPDFDKSCKKRFDCLFVGNVSIIKGVQYLLEAWQQLKLQDARLVICGSIHRDMQDLIGVYLGIL